MTAEIITLPYSVTRKLHARKSRKSKNGTPEERAAKAATAPQKPASLAVAAPVEKPSASVLAFRRPAETVPPAAAADGRKPTRRDLYSDTFFRLPFVTLPETPPAEWGEFWRVVDMWNAEAAAATYRDGVAHARSAVEAICQDGVGARQLEIVVARMLESAFRRRDTKGNLCRGLSSSEKGFLDALCKSAVCEPPPRNPPF